MKGWSEAPAENVDEGKAESLLCHAESERVVVHVVSRNLRYRQKL